MTESGTTPTVFISYASQDVGAAQKICDALRAAHIEVWLDQTELRGGDAWDAGIRSQIKSCALFIPVISQTTSGRDEGYFRLEWKLAIDRSHLMAPDRAFIVPVVIDATRESEARVPERFTDIQWTRLPGGAATPEFVARIALLITGDSQPGAERAPAHYYSVSASGARRPLPRAALAAGAVLVVVVAVVWIARALHGTSAQINSSVVATTPASGPTLITSTTVPDKSIAVLPFVDMSEKKDQEYFSDGLSEELIDRLTHATDLMVISRTSSFFFKGKQATIGDIAKTLGVRHVLEGSVRKSGSKLRITAQLIRASDGSHLWSQTYDRDLADIFKVQDEIAGTVANALEVALRSGTTGRSEASQEAYSLLLKGNYFSKRGTEADDAKALQLYTEATRLDPNYALAWAKVAAWTNKDTSKGLATALYALQRSLRIDPKLAYAHYVLGWTHLYFESDWPAAKTELEHAIDLDPDDPRPRVELAWLIEGMFGNLDRKILYQRQSVLADPLSAGTLDHMANSLFIAGRYGEAIDSYRKLLELSPGYPGAFASIGVALMYLHRPREALAEIARETDEASQLWGLAIVNWEIGKRAESDSAVSRLEGKYGSSSTVYAITEAHAYRGEIDAAFKSLDRTYQLNRFYMSGIMVYRELRNLHGDPRFEAMIAKMKLDDWKRKVFATGA